MYRKIIRETKRQQEEEEEQMMATFDLRAVMVWGPGNNRNKEVTGHSMPLLTPIDHLTADRVIAVAVAVVVVVAEVEAVAETVVEEVEVITAVAYLG